MFFAHLTHANIKMPRKIDRTISYVFVTPNIFGTYAEVNDPYEIKCGIDTHMDPDENDRVGNLLKILFQEYRLPSGKNKKHKRKNR